MVVSDPAANVLLKSASLQLQRANHLFSGRNLVMGKFGDELLKQFTQSTTPHAQSITAQSAARPLTFIPAVGDQALAGNSKTTTSKRNSKKRRQGETNGLSLPGSTGKR